MCSGLPTHSGKALQRRSAGAPTPARAEQLGDAGDDGGSGCARLGNVPQVHGPRERPVAANPAEWLPWTYRAALNAPLLGGFLNSIAARPARSVRRPARSPASPARSESFADRAGSFADPAGGFADRAGSSADPQVGFADCAGSSADPQGGPPDPSSGQPPVSPGKRKTERSVRIVPLARLVATRGGFSSHFTGGSRDRRRVGRSRLMTCPSPLRAPPATRTCSLCPKT